MAHIRQELVLGPVRLLGAGNRGRQFFQEGGDVCGKNDQSEQQTDSERRMGTPIFGCRDYEEKKCRTEKGRGEQVFSPIAETVPEGHPQENDI
jgi:hypothetical protein